MNPSVTLVKLFVFCFGAGLMVLFPPVTQSFIWQGVPMVLHDYNFLSEAWFSGGHEIYGLTVEIDWLRLASQVAALGFVIVLVRRPKRKLETSVMP